ncbi:ribose transport system permease protein [Palleronia aestuarii]|uniref:Ribose transport system permease protein n=1 Tax=Palleronia aestuarii TaxID=568105 RepID=A0A2W7PS13_9RHOB|nr:ABC transporter permease [Palleronia aestuarii]PZX12209.1 ribose transport system permease protein [Palleronia aestuarii]
MSDRTAGIGEPAATEEKAANRKGPGFSRLFRTYGTLTIFILLVLLASTQSDAFLTERNATNLLRQMSGVGIMAIGMLFVILTRGIDLSVGSIAALGAVTSAMFVQDMSMPMAVASVVLIGAACGAVSGFLIAFLRLPAFVITLAMMTGARGLALILSNGQPVMPGTSGQGLQNFGTSFTLGLPNPAWLMLSLFAIAFLILNFSRFGRLVKAIGSNEEAVRLSGISVPWYVASVYVISGALAAVAGLLVTARSGVGSAQVGVAAELDVIAAVVIGGASLMGGRGDVVNTFIGVMILGVIGNIMNLAGVPGYHQQVYLGVIIVVAVVLQNSAQLFRR